MLGVRVTSGASWFDISIVLMPLHLADLKHWALVKLSLTNWTIEVYDSLQHEGNHNSKVREGVEGLSKFIPLLAEQNSLFDFKQRDPPGNYPIPVTIMKDIPQQGNGLVQAL
jgi:Ulp1 family protease